MKISKQQARQFLLAYHHLLPPRSLQGKAGILRYLRQVGCIQYDPLNVVGRNAELILQSRIKNFKPILLEELLYKDRMLIDGWDKMMSIYCVADWPSFSRVRNIRAQQVKRVLQWRNSETALNFTAKIKQEITAKGPLSSNHFHFGAVNPGKWGHGKLASAALDYLFHAGELGIEKKIGTRKVYNLAARLIPETIFQSPDPFSTEEDFFLWYYLRRIGSIGMVQQVRSDSWLGYILKDNDKRKKAIQKLLQKELICGIEIEGIKNRFYIRKTDEPALIKPREIQGKPKASIIAPLDNLLWDRKFIKELFGFQYSWEVYLPSVKRKYGYYVLPLLYGDHFIARFEPAKDLNRETLMILNWWWEPEVKISLTMKRSIIVCMKKFMQYLGLKRIQIEKTCSKDLHWLVY